MTVEEARNSVIDILKTHPDFARIKITDEYPGTLKEDPLRRVNVAVGVESCLTESCALGDLIAERTHGRLAKIDIGVHIYVPLSLGAAKCQSVFHSAVRALAGAGLNVMKIGAGAIKADMAAGAFALWSSVGVNMLIPFDEEE